MDDLSDLVATLEQVEERLRELAYDRLRAAAEEGDPDAEREERRIAQARRAVEKALRALGHTPED
jgi:hypothetical protein